MKFAVWDYDSERWAFEGSVFDSYDDAKRELLSLFKLYGHDEDEIEEILFLGTANFDIVRESDWSDFGSVPSSMQKVMVPRKPSIRRLG